LSSSYRDRQKATNFNSHLKTFYEEFRFQFYIKIKHMHRNQNNITALYILEINSSVLKSIQVSSIVCRFEVCAKKMLKSYRVAMSNMTWATRACVQCWRNYEEFMLKQCLENIGEGLLHACISSTRHGKSAFTQQVKVIDIEKT
jgi:hypothetical protein